MAHELIAQQLASRSAEQLASRSRFFFSHPDHLFWNFVVHPWLWIVINSFTTNFTQFSNNDKRCFMLHFLRRKHIKTWGYTYIWHIIVANMMFLFFCVFWFPDRCYWKNKTTNQTVCLNTKLFFYVQIIFEHPGFPTYHVWFPTCQETNIYIETKRSSNTKKTLILSLRFHDIMLFFYWVNLSQYIAVRNMVQYIHMNAINISQILIYG